ncbi:cyclin-dependent kinase F-4-like [Mercurialis annua]|uniref:cyclin-dependent kinase F-4-like n=1 Tax=Mercurialis annua TaxID=3986 RepID=UPI002160E494|nr:cyclin-dependent kinase F-4-like [Mercurialis annua]
MEKYLFLEPLGEGSYGSVWQAENKTTKEIVAIKIVKKSYYTLQQCLNLPEVKASRKMNHPNIVKLKEISLEMNTLFLVFECMDCNLSQLIQHRKRNNLPFSESEIRNLCFQIFHALDYMHRQGYFHRDLKPENLLLKKGIIKIGDLGLAREVHPESPYTQYVGTRWYEAPEVLLGSRWYSSKADMWAMGAIIAELFSLSPLFPGRNGGDQMQKICKIMGSPTVESWPNGVNLAGLIGYQFPELGGTELSSVVPSAGDEARSLIEKLCSWDPSLRPTAVAALRHPFFQSCYFTPDRSSSSLRYGTTASSSFRKEVEDPTRDLLQRLKFRDESTVL